MFPPHTAVEGEEILAPYLFISEVANSLWKYIQAGEMEPALVSAKAQEAYNYVDTFVPDTELMPEAILEASAMGHSAYEMFYLVLARRKKLLYSRAIGALWIYAILLVWIAFV